MSKLNQIIAIHASVAQETEKALTKLYHGLQRSTLMTGISRHYRPLVDDDPEKFPDESNAVRMTGESILVSTQAACARLFDVTFSQELTNTVATGDIVVDDVVLLPDVPVVYLLFMERQLLHIRTMVRTIPTLSEDRVWKPSQATGVWATDPVESIKTKKRPQRFVKYDATTQHPAQVEFFYEDYTQGYWSTIHYSGALPMGRYVQLLQRVETLLIAVKFAREQANQRDVLDRPGVSQVIFGYLFAPGETATA